MIELRNLTKQHGTKTVVDTLSFQVRPGTITGFLVPNGAGKSTTMRMLVGLGQPTSGSESVIGRPYIEHLAPMREIGVLLDAATCCSTCRPRPAAFYSVTPNRDLLSSGAGGAVFATWVVGSFLAAAVALKRRSV